MAFALMIKDLNIGRATKLKHWFGKLWISLPNLTISATSYRAKLSLRKELVHMYLNECRQG